LPDAGKLGCQPARPARPAPEEIEGRVVHRPVVPAADEDGAARDPDVPPLIHSDQGERLEESGRLPGVHIQTGPP
jgi:hypothetical protein